jgi:hypothetical protein
MTCDYHRMKLRDFFARAVAILLIGSLMCSPLAAMAAGTDAIADVQAMSPGMAMDVTLAGADEMPCHKSMPNNGKACPIMAMCMAICCQAIPISSVSLAPPAFIASRMLPPRLVELDGMKSPPPSRPPKA